MSELRGGLDPREMQRRSTEARKRNREAKATEVYEAYKDVPLEQLGLRVLRELASNPKTPDAVRAQASKILLGLPGDDEESAWKRSVQVRPDYREPTWPEVLLVAKAAGAFEVK